ncbi:MAG: RNA methyltransferase [Clostridia bacterium]|nr:RNA methyltransferase [Clostridia bacterium]
MGKVFLGLVHYPIYNKRMEIISTSVTNLDIHDIARTVTTYGLEKYYLIHPLPTQQAIIKEILDYWQKGYGSIYNPDRKTALEKVVLKSSLAEVEKEITNEYPQKLKLVVTDARLYENSIGYRDLRREIEENEGTNFLLLFGTGWGIAREIMEKADYRLYPIMGSGEYNHLSVRSAVAIILDRLCGEKWW